MSSGSASVQFVVVMFISFCSTHSATGAAVVKTSASLRFASVIVITARRCRLPWRRRAPHRDRTHRRRISSHPCQRYRGGKQHAPRQPSIPSLHTTVDVDPLRRSRGLAATRVLFVQLKFPKLPHTCLRERSPITWHAKLRASVRWSEFGARSAASSAQSMPPVSLRHVYMHQRYASAANSKPTFMLRIAIGPLEALTMTTEVRRFSDLRSNNPALLICIFSCCLMQKIITRHVSIINWCLPTLIDKNTWSSLTLLFDRLL